MNILIAVCMLLFPQDSGTEATNLQAQQIGRQVDALMQPLVEEDIIRGSILIANNETILFAKGYGYANNEKKEPNIKSTIFLIGSNTKSFTAFLTMLLVNDGRLSLDDPLDKYVPGFKYGSEITIHHLLSNTSGIPSYIFIPGWPEMLERKPPLDSIIDWFRKAEPSFAPGERYEYSNSNFVLLTKIIEIAGGAPYAEQLERRICKPLGMKDTALDDSRVEVERRAYGYSKNDIGDTVRSRTRTPFGSGDGDLHSTVLDLYLWARMLLGDELLPYEIKQKMFTPVHADYGYGFMTDRLRDREYIHHGGALFGFLSDIFIFPKSKTIVISLFNCDGMLAFRIQERLAAIACGDPVEPIYPPLDKELTDTFSSYTGTYVQADGSTMTIAAGENGFVFQWSSDPFVRMRPLSADSAYVPSQNALVRFSVEEGKVNIRVYFGTLLVEATRK